MNPKLLALYNRLAKGELLNEVECRELADLELLQMRDSDVTVETRLEAGLELRAAAADSKIKNSPGTIVGRPAKFNTLSKDLGGFKENILPGAFSETLGDSAQDVRALVGHDKNRILGRRSAGTLEIREDEKGLAVAIHLIDTTEGRDAYNNIQAGNLDAMSFGFKPKKVKWSQRDGTMVRDLVSVRLGEVSVVGEAAYPNTELAAREFKEYGNVMAHPPVRLLRLRRAAYELRDGGLTAESGWPEYNSIQSQAATASYQATSASKSARMGVEQEHLAAKMAHEKAAKLHELAAKASPDHHLAIAAEHKALAKMHGSKC